MLRTNENRFTCYTLVISLLGSIPSLAPKKKHHSPVKTTARRIVGGEVFF